MGEPIGFFAISRPRHTEPGLIKAMAAIDANAPWKAGKLFPFIFRHSEVTIRHILGEPKVAPLIEVFPDIFTIGPNPRDKRPVGLWRVFETIGAGLQQGIDAVGSLMEHDEMVVVAFLDGKFSGLFFLAIPSIHQGAARQPHGERRYNEGMVNHIT